MANYPFKLSWYNQIPFLHDFIPLSACSHFTDDDGDSDDEFDEDDDEDWDDN